MRRATKLLAVLAAAAAISAARPKAQQTTPVPADGQFANLGTRELWYRDTGGAGVPVVLLHARTGSALAWERQLPAFVARGYRVIAYDRLGSGRSRLAANAAAGTAADDLEALITQLKLPRFHLIGTAAGGIVALDYAVSFPHRLRGLVVANSIGGVQDPDYVALGRRIRPSPQFDQLPPDVREVGPSFRAGDPAGLARWVEIEHASRPQVADLSPQPTKNRLTFQLLESMRVPTLLITGGADLYAPPPVMRLFAARIAGAETLIFPEAGHSAYWEDSDGFNRAVLAFLSKH
jgi:pimeloyl-ACP methyl ester carboxylesterase